jgi:hypothetical protein
VAGLHHHAKDVHKLMKLAFRRHGDPDASAVCSKKSDLWSNLGVSRWGEGFGRGDEKEGVVRDRWRLGGSGDWGTD